MKKKKILFVIAVLIIIIAIMLMIFRDKENENSEVVIYSANVEANYDVDEEDTNWADESVKYIELSNESISITSAGTYHLTGTIENGSVTINAKDTDVVRLVLENVNITSSNGPAINVENAKKVILILEEGSTNNITDGENYNNIDADGEPNGAIFSKDDLVINGYGTLNVQANFEDGIVSKDDLKILNSTINISAKDDGIRGKDYIAIKKAKLDITCECDGLKSTETTDTTKGYIIITSSEIKITSTQDAIQAETFVKIEDGTFDITTGGGSQNSSTQSSNWGMWRGQTQSSQTEESAKAIKGNSEVYILAGTFNIDSSDDSIHSNGNVVIDNGTFNITSGDDGIHADENLVINNGNINIAKSYEGIESANMEINGGTINVIASDDGINIAGGNDSSAINGRPGQNNFSSSTNQSLIVNNGEITIDADGDGIDINGAGYINGGTLVINGTTSGGNGFLDYDREFKITGGIVIATGSSDMLQTPSNSSTQYAISAVLTNSQTAGSKITLKDSEDKNIVEFTSEKNFTAILISTPEIIKGETYKLYINDEEYTNITISDIITSIGNTNNFGMPSGGMMQDKMNKPGMR